MNKNEMIKALLKPFPAEAIDWRVGATNADKSKGIALAYLQARPVMDRLDEVVGQENWQDAYTPIHGASGLAGFICGLSLKISGEWVTKTDGSDTSDVEPIKGGFSDSFKRAAVKWGVGRYLYDLPTIWEALEPKGKSYVLKSTPILPAWALPSGKSAQLATPVTSKVEQPEKDKPADPVTLEAACAMTNSSGVQYGSMPAGVLEKIISNLYKTLNTVGLAEEDKAVAERKLKSAKMVYESKKAQEIA